MRSIDRRPSGDAHARGCAPRTSGERFIQRSADGEGCAGDVARIGERHEVTRTPQFKALRRLPGNRRRLPWLAGRWAAWLTAALPFAGGLTTSTASARRCRTEPSLQTSGFQSAGRQGWRLAVKAHDQMNANLGQGRLATPQHPDHRPADRRHAPAADDSHADQD